MTFSTENGQMKWKLSSFSTGNIQSTVGGGFQRIWLLWFVLHLTSKTSSSLLVASKTSVPRTTPDVRRIPVRADRPSGDNHHHDCHGKTIKPLTKGGRMQRRLLFIETSLHIFDNDNLDKCFIIHIHNICNDHIIQFCLMKKRETAASRVYEIIMGMCLKAVNRPAKRPLVEGEWTEGGNWKWSQLFPFPQSVYGNAFGARFSSHAGGKGPGSASKRERGY